MIEKLEQIISDQNDLIVEQGKNNLKLQKLLRDSEENKSYLQKLDTSESGLFVMKVNENMSMEDITKLKTLVSDGINKFAPGSEVIVLGPMCDSIGVAPEDNQEM